MEDRMRVCLVSREVSTFTGGGIGTYAVEMVKAWKRAGHEVHLLTDRYEGLAERGASVMPGVEIHTIDTGSGWAAVDAYPAYPLRHSMAVHEALSALHGAHGFDYIEFADYWGEGYVATRARRATGAYAGALIAMRLHTPTFYVRRLNAEMDLRPDFEHLEHMEEQALREADALFSPCASLLETVREELGRVKGRYEEVIPYPFDSAPLTRMVADDLAPPAEGPKEVLYYGRMERRKGVLLLVEAAQRLLASGEDVRFRLIGGDTQSGPFGRSMLELMKARLGDVWRDRFILEPGRPREALGAAIRSAHVCCFPSLWENYPNVCLEAMSLGGCVVGSNAGGMSEMIEEGVSGFTFESGSAGALEAALRRALGLSAEERAAMGRAAAERIGTICEPSRVVGRMEEAVGRAREAAGERESAREERRKTAAARVEGTSDGPLITVAVPFYNLGAYLPATLESLKKQTFRDFETVIVDDGSTEPDSLRLLDRLVGAGHRIVRKPNGGLSSARNKALEVARGRWFYPLDADDVIDPTCLERLVKARRRNPDDAFATSYVRYFVDHPETATGGWLPFGLDRDVLATRNCASNAACLIDTELVRKVGGYDEWLTSYEDWDLYCTLAERGLSACIVPEFLYYYRVRPHSMMRTEAVGRHYLIKAYLAAKHPDLASAPARSLRMQIAESQNLREAVAWYTGELDRLQQRVAELEVQAAHAHAPNGADLATAHAMARQMIEENIRYRAVDRMNDVLKALHVQKPLKVTMRALKGKRGAENGSH
jgi:glycosyltransferase involved in cell wall biosynthesis/GT2 family glycosyltransferase